MTLTEEMRLAVIRGESPEGALTAYERRLAEVEGERDEAKRLGAEWESLAKARRNMRVTELIDIVHLKTGVRRVGHEIRGLLARISNNHENVERIVELRQLEKLADFLSGLTSEPYVFVTGERMEFRP